MPNDHSRVVVLLCVLGILGFITGINSFAIAQTVTIFKPTPDQAFCGMGPFDIPVLATLPVDECEDVIIEWSVTIENVTYTTTTLPNQPGIIYVGNPPTQDASFGITTVTAVAVQQPAGPQQFSGTGWFYGDGALRVTVHEAGQDFEGYILNNCDPYEQDMVVGEQTDGFQAGTSELIKGYCTDASGGIPSPGRAFSAPWTSQSTSHWAYWERQAIIYANQNGYDPVKVLYAIWYVSDRSGEYNEILSGIAYPPNGPTKNFEEDLTPPTTPIVTDDGNTTDDNTRLHATWTSDELESGIVEYLYAIGTEVGATNVVDWTSAGAIPEVTHGGLHLERGTYYFAVKAKNGAGLWSEPGHSDGILVTLEALTAYLDIKPGSCPNPVNLEHGDADPTDDSKSRKGGVMTVAVLGLADFDVTEIDVGSVRLEGVEPVQANFDDVASPVIDGEACECNPDGADGFMDLKLKFLNREIVTAIRPASDGDLLSLTLTGVLKNGTRFEATDCVKVIGKDTRDEPDMPNIIEETALGVAYPNPFNPVTRILYTLKTPGAVSLNVYDVRGKLVKRLESGVRPAGEHVVEWDAGEKVPSGIYFYRLEVGDFVQTRKMMLLK